MMVSAALSNGAKKGGNSLIDIVGKSAEEIRSQVGRVGSDLSLARNFGQTLLSNGIIDDRKYLVRKPKTNVFYWNNCI